MKILGIDTSSNPASVAVTEGDRVIAEAKTVDKSKRSIDILPLIDTVLTQSGISLGEVDVYAVAIGPGSFTGLRIGLALCKGFALANKKPVVGVSTLKSIARSSGLEGRIAVLMDARRNEVYCGLFEAKNNEINLIGEEKAVLVDEFCAEISAETFFIGDGAILHQERLKKRLDKIAQFPSMKDSLSIAGGVAFLAQKELENGKGEDYNLIVPRYIRRSEAEMKLERRI